ncbi:kinase-like domain-containing protein [Chytriomyces sp. MP71]|nr:kinase-like domain-containing protein [Chytriomyces sp. MP71]
MYILFYFGDSIAHRGKEEIKLFGPNLARMASFPETQPATLSDAEGDDESNASSMWAKLVSLDLRQSSFELVEPKDVFVVGRDPKRVDFEVANENVSSVQCRIVRIVEDGLPDDAILVEDLSRFGTFVNGKLLGRNKKTLLTHGTEISFGSRAGKGFMFQIVPKSGASKPESPFEAKYILQSVLGSGSFSTVRLAVNRETGTKVAVKMIEKSRFAFNDKVMQALESEVQIMRSLSHENIVQFLDHFEERGIIYIIMEFVNGGDLFGFVRERGHLDEDKARFFLRQMVVALKFIKSKGITHRDLKPDNFLVTHDTHRLKLADFGVAKKTANAANLRTLCGTPVYLAPEVINPPPGGAGYDSRVDVYSAGAILFFLLSGCVPFEEVEQKALFERIERGGVDWSAPVWAEVSPAGVDLVRQLMQVKPELRIRLEDIEAHPWMRGERTLPAVGEVVAAGLPRPRLFGQLVATRSILALKEALCRIGRAPDNSVVLSDPRISRHHCTISFREDAQAGTMAFLKVDTSGSNQLKVNTKPVIGKEPVQLHDGDHIQLAPAVQNLANQEYLFKIVPAPTKRGHDTDPVSPPPATSPSHPTPRGPKRARRNTFRLVPKGAFRMSQNLVDANAVSIGRLPECSIVMDFAFVSSRHCTVTREPTGDVVIRDTR